MWNGEGKLKSVVVRYILSFAQGSLFFYLVSFAVKYKLSEFIFPVN